MLRVYEKIKRVAERSWISAFVFVLFLIAYELIKDRLLQALNNTIDEGANQMWEVVKPWLSELLIAPLGYTVMFAIVVLLAIVVHAYYREIKEEEPFSLIKRISLLEFYKHAEENGWHFFKDHHLLFDLNLGLKQAAVDGLVVYGRKEMTSDNRDRSGTLNIIPSCLWEKPNFGVNHVSAFILNTHNGDIVSFVDDNFNTSCEAIWDKSGKHKYKDIHLDKEQALKWFQHEAAQYQGISRKAHGR